MKNLIMLEIDSKLCKKKPKSYIKTWKIMRIRGRGFKGQISF